MNKVRVKGSIPLPLILGFGGLAYCPYFRYNLPQFLHKGELLDENSGHGWRRLHWQYCG